MAFVKRKIDLTFRMGTGTFGESGYNTVKVSGLRVRADIQKTGAPEFGTAEVRVVGLTPDLINQLSAVYSWQTLARKNTLIIEAGNDDGTPLHMIFQGQIFVAQADYNNPPDSALNIIAKGGMLYALQNSTQLSYPGQADVFDICSTLATNMGLKFEGNNAHFMLSTPVIWGSLLDQFKSVLRMAPIEGTIDDTTLAIWPRGGARVGGAVLINEENGMVGYPSYSNFGIAVKTEFNPQVKFAGSVYIASDLKQANGTWTVFGLTHELDSEQPGGSWFTHIAGARYG